MRMNATSNAANPKYSRKRKEGGVRPPVRAEEPKRGGLTLEVLRGRVTVEDEGPQPAPLMEEEQPTPHLRVSRQAEKRAAPCTPSAGGADKSSENAKKRRLNWHPKCLQASGVEVKIPEEGWGGGSEDEDSALWITVKSVTRSTRVSYTRALRFQSCPADCSNRPR